MSLHTACCLVGFVTNSIGPIYGYNIYSCSNILESIISIEIETILK